MLETQLGCKGCKLGLGPIDHGQSIWHPISHKSDLQGLADSSESGGSKPFYLYSAPQGAETQDTHSLGIVQDQLWYGAAQSKALHT